MMDFNEYVADKDGWIIVSDGNIIMMSEMIRCGQHIGTNFTIETFNSEDEFKVRYFEITGLEYTELRPLTS